MATLRQELEGMGATPAQLKSKVVDMAEQVIAEGAVEGLTEARREVERLEREIGNASRKMVTVTSAANEATAKGASLRRDIEVAHRVMAQIRDATDDCKETAAKVTLTDETLIQSVNMYREVLSSTKDAVGDQMTEQIWIKAIEAASYGMWRAIMGPKFEEKEERRRRL